MRATQCSFNMDVRHLNLLPAHFFALGPMPTFRGHIVSWDPMGFWACATQPAALEKAAFASEATLREVVSGFGIGKTATETTLVAEPVLCWLRRALLHHYFQDNYTNEPNATPPTSLHLVQVGISELWHRWRTSWRTSSTGCFGATS